MKTKNIHILLVLFTLTTCMVNGQTAKLVRGPYLQTGTSSSVIVRWRSDIATDAKVKIGQNPASLIQTFTQSSVLTEHEVKVTGLSPSTKYYYSIGSSSQTLQGDTANYFITAPITGSSQKIRLWVMGDIGNGTANEFQVRDQYMKYMGKNYTDALLLLGDNAYMSGYDNEYQNNFFNVYKDGILKNTVVWPALGNHDYANNSTRQNDHAVAYFDIFSLPMNGEAGGIASGSEAFYSYDYANVHFVVLDSYGREQNTYRLYDTLNPQVTWLKKDLAANKQKWTIVYFHHPPYTMGSHNSDTEFELISIRKNIIPILERYKVDLVLNGHSHCYERSRLMKGHLGTETTFDPAIHNVSQSSAKNDGSTNSCPYVKNSSGAYNGTVYVVNGAGAADFLSGSQAAWPHNAMYYADVTNGGSMSIEIDSNRLESRFVCADGIIRDQFTIYKDVNNVQNLSIQAGQSIELNASWKGNYNWSEGSLTQRITVKPNTTTTYSVQDDKGCLKDVYNITVINPEAPVISNVTSSPLIPKSTEPVQVSATVFSTTSVQSVKLLWGYNSAQLNNEIQMLLSGNTYQAIIPNNPDGSVVFYQITATNANLVSTSTSQASYTVKDNLINSFVDFDNKDLSFTGFGGNNFVKVSNPFPTGINISGNVGQCIKGNPSETWSGIFSSKLSSKIDFSVSHIFKMKTYSPKACTVLFKLEDYNNSSINKEVSATTTILNEWEDLSFDFTGAASGTYDKITLFFDFGNTTGNTFYFDDIRLTNDIPTGIVYENSFSQIKIYPNPSEKNLILENGRGKKIGKVTIRSIDGKEVYKTTSEESFVTLNISLLESGIYFIRIETDGEIINQKIIKR